MTINARWFNDEQTIVILEISGRWTWDELYVAYEQVLSMMSSKTGNIHAIMNRAQDEYRSYAPPNAIVHSVSLIRKLPKNFGLGVIVDSGSQGLRALYDAIARIYPPFGRKLAIVTTLDEAITRIARYDERESIGKT